MELLEEMENGINSAIDNCIGEMKKRQEEEKEWSGTKNTENKIAKQKTAAVISASQ